MSLLDTYQEGTDLVTQFQIDRPLEPPKPKPKRSGWTTLPRAVAAGVAEVGANVSDIIGASAQAYADYGLTQNPLQPMTDQQRAERDQAIKDFSPNFRPEQSKPLYEFSENLRVDPQLATTAESIFFGITKGLTKAIPAAIVGGPLVGASVLGVSEGMTQAEELAQQGVDVSTRTKVGAVTGAVTGLSALVPVAGNTIAQTAGLALASGPAAYMAQQKLTSEILSRANYPEIAQQYDPLDPVGLTVAALLPFGLGVHSMKAASRATARQTAKGDTSAAPTAEVQPGVQDAQPAPVKTQNFETQENVDVAMVQNLTVQRDIADYIVNKQQEDISVAANKLTAQESRSLKQESTQLAHSIEFEQARYQETFKQLAKDQQAAGLSRKQAEAAARTTLADIELTAKSRLDLINAQLNQHAMALQAEERLNRMNNGASPVDVYGLRESMPETSFVTQPIKVNETQIGNAQLQDEIIRTTEQARASQTRTAESNPLKPADNQPTVIAQQIERMVTENPNMHVSVREDGTRVRLADEVEAVRREIMNGTDDELGTNDAKLVEAAINCFLGD